MAGQAGLGQGHGCSRRLEPRAIVGAPPWRPPVPDGPAPCPACGPRSARPNSRPLRPTPRADTGREDHAGSFVDGVIGAAKAKRSPVEACTAKQDAEPLPIPGWRAGKQVVASKYFDHALRDGVMELPCAQQHAARDMVDRLGVFVPVGPRRCWTDAVVLGPSALRRTSVPVRRPVRGTGYGPISSVVENGCRRWGSGCATKPTWRRTAWRARCRARRGADDASGAFCCGTE